MAMKAMFQVLVLALVFSMLGKHQVWGETDCYQEKESVKFECKNSIRNSGPYVLPRPGDRCCAVVEASDMACICRILDEEEEKTISAARLVRVAERCGNPLPNGSNCGTSHFHPPPPPPPSGAHPIQKLIKVVK
ncbi:hypothetical protein BS78_06G156500 [Paspalum vaginatum]|nr:hypothetical protein BS78_06G156500 [Paspalum vaginatum]